MGFEKFFELGGFFPRTKGEGGLKTPGDEFGRMGNLSSIVRLEPRLQISGQTRILLILVSFADHCVYEMKIF